MKIISINETDYCKLLVQVEADENEIAEKRNEIITKFKQYPVKGFRKGKATNEAIKTYFKKEINNALTQQLADDAFQNTLFEKNVRPFGQPQFTQVKLDNNKFSCEFSLHKQPDFQLNQYKGFEIPKPAGVMAADELAAKMLQELRERNGATTAYGEDDFVQMGDSIIIDYSATIDGVPVAGLKAEGEVVSVGKIEVPGFSENVLGMKSGEQREFELNLKYSEDKTIPSDQWEYKVIKFDVKIHMGSKIVPAGLDDAFAKQVGLNSLNVLMENVNTMALNRVKETEKAQIIDQISRRLIENHDFAIPTWISTAEARINAKNAGKDWNVISDSEKELYIKQSENSVKLSLVLEKIREEEPNCQLSNDELMKIAQSNISRHTTDPQKVFEELYKNGHLPIFLNRIKDEYALDAISKECTIVE